MANLSQLFTNTKLTENGDIAYSSTGHDLLDILFMSEYYQHHLNEAMEKLGDSEKAKIFAMFIRDPRFGLGKRNLGRALMFKARLTPEEVVKAGRYDDLFHVCERPLAFHYFESEIRKGNELAKKWAPRYSSKKLMLARDFAKWLGMNKQQYGKFVKAATVEQSLSRKNTDEIVFEHVPSLALIKYYKRFAEKADTSERFAKYLSDVKNGDKEMKIATTTVYDIYRNRERIDADLFFEKLEKISINCIPIIDSSGSMQNSQDCYGKAMAIGHYLSKCSTYANGQVISFSSRPQLMTICGKNYKEEVESLHTGDYTNTDFGAVMNILKGLDEFPEYLVVLSDMEFDYGSHQSRAELKRIWDANGCKTKIVWWNLNPRSTTSPEVDAMGNIFMSGYSPMLLKFLEAGFDGEKFLDKLLVEYQKRISE